MIRGLVGAGYRVSYLMGDAFRDAVQSTGADFLEYDSVFPRLGGASKRNGPETDRPDLVLHDTGAPVAGFSAEKLGIPAIALEAAFAFWDGAEQELLQQMGGVDLADPRVAELRAAQRRMLGEYGLEAWSERFSFDSRPKKSLLFIPEALQPQPEKLDRCVYHFAGVAISTSQSELAWAAPAGKKLMLISLGSIVTQNAPFYRACMEAFGGLAGWHVVLQIGPLTTVEELGEIPANVEVHHWLPQVAILKRADVFLTHAGMGGSREGLALGVPMIAAPQAVDQFQNADSLVAAGVAAKVDGFEVTAAELRAALAAAQQPAIRERSREIAREMAEQDGVRFSLEFIASLLADKVAV
ncbi:nucleotide disphospho-sugar-binding domain-containing protein [Arthrobacter russicus]|uniref:nucleotide disphospho-sugar-binding domain-containing protein n=1 Tax=Arthrobacter russicus TaxID=172040 RepID=UPI003CE79734